MSEPCVPVESLGDHDAWAADDPRRVHVAACPRCAAALASYRAFVTDAPLPAAAGAASAHARLDAALARALEGGAVAGAIRPRPRVRWTALAAAAAVVIVAALVWMRPGPLGPGDRDVLRGPKATTALRLDEPAATSDGVRLAWTAHPEADGYEVVVLDPSMREALRVSAGAETTLVLRRAALGDRVAAGAVLAWRVEALARGERRATSAVGTLEAP